MMLTGRHLNALKLPLAVLAIVAIAGAGAVSWTRAQIKQAARTLAAQEGQLQEARSRFQRSGEERDLIVRFLPAYEELRSHGLIGPEERISWLEALRTANQQARMFGAEYQISTQQPYPYAQELNATRLGMAQSLMKLNLRLAHEAELMRFFRLLEKQDAGAFDINECVMQRVAGNTDPGVAQPNLMAECELAWITINPAPADHKP
jgi:hypothetical protein